MSLSTMIGAPHSPLLFPASGFVALHRLAPATQAAPRERHSADQALTVAALPFRNHTGRDELVWVEFGLAALLNRELQAQHGIAVLPLVDVVTALKGSATDSPPAARAEAVVGSEASQALSRLAAALLGDLQPQGRAAVVRHRDGRGRDLVRGEAAKPRP